MHATKGFDRRYIQGLAHTESASWAVGASPGQVGRLSVVIILNHGRSAHGPQRTCAHSIRACHGGFLVSRAHSAFGTDPKAGHNVWILNPPWELCRGKCGVRRCERSCGSCGNTRGPCVHSARGHSARTKRVPVVAVHQLPARGGLLLDTAEADVQEQVRCSPYASVSAPSRNNVRTTELHCGAHHSPQGSSFFRHSELAKKHSPSNIHDQQLTHRTSACPASLGAGLATRRKYGVPLMRLRHGIVSDLPSSFLRADHGRKTHNRRCSTFNN